MKFTWQLSNQLQKIKDALKNLSVAHDDKIQLPHVLNKTILREYDVRGVFEENLFEEDAYNIGRAFGTYMIRKNLKKLCVGRDCRNSSYILDRNLRKGLRDSGVEVILLGVCHTPMMYYTVNKLKLDAGIMVTGSHNLPNCNGFKFMIGMDPFYGDDIQLLGDMIEREDFCDGVGREMVLNKIFKNYISDILDGFNFSDDLKVVWDIGNGATSRAIKAITSLIPGKHHLLFEEMDGNFPNRAPDPTVAENVKYLSAFVINNNFDIGFGFDSDGDRLCVVDSKGNILYSDQVLEVFARDFLKKNPAAQVVAGVKCCNRLFDVIRECGGIGIMEKVGHSFIKMRMKSSGALLAGEMSGHFFFKDRWYGFDDGIYAALRCLEIVSANKDAFNNLPYGFVTPEIRIPCDQKVDVIDYVKERLNAEQISFSEIDGVRVSMEYGWWLIRSSNTQNALSLRIEAYQKKYMPIIKSELSEMLSRYVPEIAEFLGNDQ